MPENETDIPRTRPYILSLFCIALFVYTGTLSIIFLFSALFNEWITLTVADFFQEKIITRTNMLLLSLTGLLLNALSFIAVISIWQMKKTGLYLFSASSLLFLLFPFFLGYGNFTSLIAMGVVILCLFMFYRKLK